jgi:hypothetical protein
MPTMKVRLMLLIPAIWTSLFDITITIANQPKQYWAGDLTKANEANPIGAMFMAYHASGLFIVSGLWILLVGFLGYYLPRRISKMFLLFCVIAHSFGASTWLYNLLGFYSVLGFMLFNSILYCTIESVADREDRDAQLRRKCFGRE